MADNGKRRAAQLPFEILGAIREIEVIAAGKGIRELARLRKTYGPGRWRKLKGDRLHSTFQWQDSASRTTLV
jgi:hypothetical protein